jgi:hypothetical protein
MLKTKRTKITRRVLYGVSVLAAGVIMMLAGCYPGEVESVQELDLVVTLFNQDANFSAYKTYAMPDSIIHICDVPAEEQNCPSELTRRYDAQILSQIETNLRNTGFTEAADPQQADVLVVVAANASDIVGYAYYGWYWNYWYGYPGGGWYYPGYYPGYAVPYEYTTGTLLINMFDPAKADTTNKRLGGVWLAAVNGLLGEGGNAQTRINTSIDQAFAQSPYLAAGK